MLCVTEYVGYSLGGQVVGQIGSRTADKVAKITGTIIVIKYISLHFALKNYNLNN